MLSIPSLTQIVTVLAVTLALTAVAVAALATWFDDARLTARRQANAPAPTTVPSPRTSPERIHATR